MDNNKLLNNRQNTNMIVNKVSGYCAKCLRELSGSDDVTRDNDGNLFCDFQCKQDYWREANKELDCCLSEWRRSGR